MSAFFSSRSDPDAPQEVDGPGPAGAWDAGMNTSVAKEFDIGRAQKRIEKVCSASMFIPSPAARSPCKRC